MRIPRTDRLLGAGAVFTLVLAFCATERPSVAQTPRLGPITQTFTSSGSPPIKACGLSGQNSATFQATGAGPIDAQVSNDGVSWTNASISNMAGTTQTQPFTPTSGTTYQVIPLNADCFQITPDSTWSGQTVTITVKLSGSIASAGFGGGGGGNVTITNTPGVTIQNTPGVVCVSGCAGGAQPTPIYTSPVSCATPSCNVADYQGTSPWVVTTINPSLPAPQATWPVSCAAASNCPVNDTQVTSPWVVGQTTGTNLHAVIDNTTPMPVLTPAPAPTNATDNGINVHISGGSPAPIPTFSPGLVAPVIVVGATPGAQTVVNGVYPASVDTAGNHSVVVCTRNTAQCAANVLGGAGGGARYLGAYGGPLAEALVTPITDSSCHNIVSVTALITGFTNVNLIGTTDTITFYNENAANCTAADAFYVVTIPSAAASSYVPWPFYCSNGVTFKASATPTSGIMYVDYL